MKSLEEIQKEVEQCSDLKKREENATCYRAKFTEEIGDDRNKLLAYKDKCNQKVNLNLPTFWMSTCAVIFSLFSVGINIMDLSSWFISLIAIIMLIVIIAIYYNCVYKEIKKYSIAMLVLEDIEKVMDKKF